MNNEANEEEEDVPRWGIIISSSITVFGAKLSTKHAALELGQQQLGTFKGKLVE